jgi:hypothetical protein
LHGLHRTREGARHSAGGERLGAVLVSDAAGREGEEAPRSDRIHRPRDENLAPVLGDARLEGLDDRAQRPPAPPPGHPAPSRELAVLAAALPLGAVAALLAAPAAGTPAADDVSILVHFRANTGTTTPPSFQIYVEIESASGVDQSVTVHTTLPPGLQWGADAPDPTEGCTNANPTVCTRRLRQNEVGTYQAVWLWDVVAERAGSYAITASVDPTEPDPDPADNSVTFRFDVVESSGGGGGASVAAGAVRLNPTRPKAGAAVSASVRVTAGGQPVRPAGIACAGAIGRTKIKGKGKAGSGTATCVYRTPRSAKGKTLRGTVSFTARGTRFSKRFSTKLG